MKKGLQYLGLFQNTIAITEHHGTGGVKWSEIFENVSGAWVSMRIVYVSGHGLIRIAHRYTNLSPERRYSLNSEKRS
jgi:hypothetical protein